MMFIELVNKANISTLVNTDHIVSIEDLKGVPRVVMSNEEYITAQNFTYDSLRRVLANAHECSVYTGVSK